MNNTKEKLIEAARVAQAQPTTFWKDVEHRMHVRDKSKQSKVEVQPRPIRKN
jgi:hypothetical protein